MSPEALDLMQREKMTKMVIKDFFLEQDNVVHHRVPSIIDQQPELTHLQNLLTDYLLDDMLQEFKID